MATHYYIDTENGKDGPHDLVTIMRRIRAQKISATTGIYLNDADEPIAASQLTDTNIFFSKEEMNSAEIKPKHIKIDGLKLKNLLKDGWRFTAENSIMTVFAGGVMLITLLVGAGLIGVLGIMLGGMLTWLMHFMMFYVFQVSCLRLFCGQRFSAKYLNETFFPNLSLLLSSSIIIGLMLYGGFILLLIPGLIVAMYYVFVPFFIIDRQFTLIEAMHASRLLALKHNGRYQLSLAAIILLYVLCYVLIIPAPVLFPILAAAQAKLYEDLSNS